MSGNVPVAQPPSGLEAWRRSLPWWDGYFAVVAIGTIGFAVNVKAAVPLLVLVIWYLVIGRQAVKGDHPTRLGVVYLTGAGLLLALGLSFDSGASFILFALSPQAHMALGFRWGTVATVVLNLMPPVALYLRLGLWIHPMWMGLLAIVLTTVMGYSFDKVIDQSMQLAQSRAEVARLSREAERQRLGADLHDTIAQGLSSVVMLVQAADAALDRDKAEARRHLDLAALTARENLKEVRAVLDALMPSGEDLPRALQRLTQRSGAELVVNGQPRPLPIPAEVVLLRAAQESLANAQRHASASQVSVGLSFDPGSVRLQVRDNGQGFDPSQTFAGYGISAMKSRVTQAGGQFTVTSEPGDTRISVEVPA
jgi:signal transduction histidine kinase